MWTLNRRVSSCRFITMRKLAASTRFASTSEILDKIRARDPLPLPDPNIEHLVSGRSGHTDDNSSAGGDIDIADKTQLILQSSHPIRYIIEREILRLQNEPNHISYHNWVTIFGRCLGATKFMNSKESNLFEQRLNYISNASECGMFSSDVHQTVLNIPSTDAEISTDQWTQFHMGNKYAVLVGDYFAVKTIFYAQKTKVNKVFLCITRGIEDFTSAPFSSKLIDNSIWYPIVPTRDSTYNDWYHYATKYPGYFTAGLYSVLAITNNAMYKSTEFLKNMNTLCTNFCLFLRIVNELEQLESVSVSPFLLVSLPAILHQQTTGGHCFEALKTKCLHATDKDFKMVQEDLAKDKTTLHHVHQLAQEFAVKTKKSIHLIGTDPIYVSVFQDIIDAIIADRHIIK